VPFLNFAPLQNAVARLERAAQAYDEAVPAALAAGRIDAADARALNAILRGLEHAMTRDGGLPRRPWFKHQIYAPGFYTGYGVKTLPGVREAIEEDDWDEAGAYIASTADVLERVATEIERATALVR
jgi:N-acetylated-alpha-linked acidic dipeptidase